MGKTKLSCEWCGRRFRPNRYNAGRQKYCLHPACVKERAQKRKRESYARRVARDEAFAKEERRRCAEANRARRARRAAAAATPPDPGPAPDPGPDLRHVVLGMLSQMTDTADPAQLAPTLRSLAERGQRLAAPLCRAFPS